MSLLLDALNKADQERKRNEATPGINSDHEKIIDHGARNKSITIVAIVFGFIILLVAIYLLGQRSATPAPSTMAAASAPAAASMSSQHNASLTPHQTASAATPDQISSAQEIDTSEDNVASLYQQNTQTQTTNATLTLSTTPTDIPTTTNEQPSATPTSLTQFANLPDLHDLPSQVLEKIPSLNYSEHNYNSNGGSVKINGNIQHANEQLAGGVVIDKILEDGMILHVGNYAFKMRALNSWINM